MPIIFDEHTSRLGGKHLMSDEPFAVIREGGEIYLSGDYTIEELREILKAAEQEIYNNNYRTSNREIDSRIAV